MKKIKSLLLLATFLVLLPLSVYASEKVNVYLFRRNGCGYCEAALEFFNKLSSDSEYSNYFNLIEKEVSESQANAKLMENVASNLNVELKGVPFIVIGKQHFEGYTSSWDENIKAIIKAAYLSEDGSYKDVVASLSNTKEDNNDAAITVIVILAVVAGVAFLIYMAKEDVSDEKTLKTEETATKENKITESVKSKTSTTKKSTTKKSTTKKASTKKPSTAKKKTSTKK